jgi:rRNA maturation protein Nop10
VSISETSTDLELEEWLRVVFVIEKKKCFLIRSREHKGYIAGDYGVEKGLVTMIFHPPRFSPPEPNDAFLEYRLTEMGKKFFGVP